MNALIFATDADFKAWKVTAQYMTDNALRRKVKECLDVAEAMSGMTTGGEGYYVDKASVFADELGRRKANA